MAFRNLNRDTMGSELESEVSLPEGYTIDKQTEKFVAKEVFMPPQYFCGPTAPYADSDEIDWSCPVFWHDTTTGFVLKYNPTSAGWDRDTSMPRIVADLETGEALGVIIPLFEEDARESISSARPVSLPQVPSRTLSEILDL